MLLNESFVPVLNRGSIKDDILKMGYSVEINQVVVDDFDEWSESWNSLRVALGLGGGGAWENGQRDSQYFRSLMTFEP